MVKICNLPRHPSFWGPAALKTQRFASEALLTAEMVFPSVTPWSDP